MQTLYGRRRQRRYEALRRMQRLTRFLTIGSLSLYLLLSLTGCGATQPVVRVQEVVLLPPDSLLEPTPIAPFVGSTNEDLLRFAVLAQESALLCNGDKAAVRAWVKTMQPP